MRKHLARVFALSIVVTVSIAMFASQQSSAAGETISGSTTFAGLVNQATAISDIQVAGSDNSTVPVRLFVSHGTLAMSTTTGLTFTGATTGARLEFSGARNDVNAALATLTYTRNSTGTDTVEVSLVDAGQVFFPDNGHLYEYVSSTQTWGGAKSAAEARTKYGATGYLATITSQSENDFVADRLDNAGWMGASDSTQEGNWKWVTGPENGTQFWSGNYNGVAVGGQYENWNTGEPNDSGNNEDCGQFLSGGSGLWNDLPCSGTTLPGYVVEYGTDASPPSVASHDATIYTLQSPSLVSPASSTAYSTMSVATTLYSAATANSVQLTYTGDVTRVLTLSSVGAGSESFTFDPSNPTAASEVVSATGSIPDGSYTVTLSYLDSLSGMALSTQSTNVTIDTTPPTVPGTPTTTSPTNDTTPTFSWAASTDDGTGLLSTPYVIQWSQDPDFAGFITTSNASTSYSIPSALAEGTWYFRVRARDAVLNYSDYSANGSVLIDTTAPTVDTTTPANNANNVLRSSQLQMTLDEPVSVGSGNFTIKKLSDDSMVESIDVTSDQVSISGNVVTVDPSNALDFSTQYYVQIDSGALHDQAGNDYTGINDSSTWAFTTEGTDVDSDGIPSLVEEAAPNNGDANNDGTPDAQQSTVASFVNSVTGEYSTVAISSDDCVISTAAATSGSSLSAYDSGYRYPLGLVNFSAECQAEGETISVSVYFFNASNASYRVRKYSSATASYTTITDASIAQESIGNTPAVVTTYQVTDGSVRDDDGIVNGEIVDPIGLGETITERSNLSSTGQSLRKPTAVGVILVAIAGFVMVFIWRRRKE